MARATSHAVVIGGSIAGLLAARVLVDRFDRVTILDRDDLPDAPVARRGAPQANHNHVLLLRGRQIMEELFPGLQESVIGDGGLPIDMASDLAWLTPFGWGVRFRSPLMMLACSRALLEWRLRWRVTRMSGVTCAPRTAVERLLVDAGRVRGVLTSTGEVEADLVVDASGRGSRATRWLTDAGWPAPAETVVNAHLGYASRFYRPGPDAGRWWKGVYVQAAPPKHPRVGVILPVEGGLWHVTIGGGDRHYPPADEDGFLEFARGLRTSAVYDAIRTADPCSPIYATRSTENRQRHFESIRVPEGFVVTGDAVCAFNPVYGQGMTAAAVAAQTLGRCLDITRGSTGVPHGRGLSNRFQKALARANQTPWMLATGEDLRFRLTEGARADFPTRLMHRYMNAVGRLATTNPRLRLRLLRAFHMAAPPRSLFSPLMFLELLRGTHSPHSQVRITETPTPAGR